MSIDETTTVTAAELGSVLGVTARRVRQLAEESVFERSERGRYPLAVCVQAYIAQIEAAADPEELKRERIELLKAQRARIEQDLRDRQANGDELGDQDRLFSGMALMMQLELRGPTATMFYQLAAVIGDNEARRLCFGFEQDVLRARLSIEQKLAEAAKAARRQRRRVESFSDLEELGGPVNDGSNDHA